jgi:hypothetical protein
MDRQNGNQGPDPNANQAPRQLNGQDNALIQRPAAFEWPIGYGNHIERKFN